MKSETLHYIDSQIRLLEGRTDKKLRLLQEALFFVEDKIMNKIQYSLKQTVEDKQSADCVFIQNEEKLFELSYRIALNYPNIFTAIKAMIKTMEEGEKNHTHDSWKTIPFHELFDKTTAHLQRAFLEETEYVKDDLEHALTRLSMILCILEEQEKDNAS